MQRVETAKANTLPHVHEDNGKPRWLMQREVGGMSVDSVLGREQMRETLWAVVMNLDLL